MRKRSSSASLQKLNSELPTRKSPLLRRIMSSALFPVLAALYYIATSVSLTLFNKLLFSKFPVSDPPVLLLCQSITAVTILSLLRLSGKFPAPVLTSWSLDSCRIYAPLYISNLAMLLTSLIALKLTSLLMYNTLRRTSMLFVVSIHCLLHNTSPSFHTVAATALVTIGAFIASKTDLAFDLLGYTLAFSANLSTAVYLVFLRPVRDKLNLSNLQLIYVNALANIPVLVIVILIMPPQEGFIRAFAIPTFTFLFLCSCSFAVVINHAIFVNTTTNDAIAQSIASQLKDVVLLMVSIVFVDDPSQRAAGNLYGVLVGFLGSLVYGIGKLRERHLNSLEQAKEKDAAVAESDASSEKVGLVPAEVK